MMKYTFLLIAFFLTYSALATGLDSHHNFRKLANINTNPERGVIPHSNANSNIKSKKITKRNSNEIVNSGERSNSKNIVRSKSLKTSSNNKSCKTYEGLVFVQGEAGYDDCILKVKSDRQVLKNNP